jgi:hypothetical protein
MTTIFDEPILYSPSNQNPATMSTITPPTTTPPASGSSWWNDLFKTIPAIISSLKGNPTNGGNIIVTPPSQTLITKDIVITIGIVAVVAILVSKFLSKSI